MDVRVDLTLDELCWCCEGTGTPPEKHKPWTAEDGSCEQCEGTGYIITKFGKSVLEFVQRHTGGKNDRS